MIMMMMVTLSLVSRDLDHFFDNSDTERKSYKRNSRIILEMKLSSE